MSASAQEIYANIILASRDSATLSPHDIIAGDIVLTDLKQGKSYMMRRTVGANSAAQKTPAVTCLAKLSHRYQTVSA